MKVYLLLSDKRDDLLVFKWSTIENVSAQRLDLLSHAEAHLCGEEDEIKETGIIYITNNK